MDIYQSIEAEKRVGDNKISAKYSKFVKDDEQKERFSKTKSNSKEKKFKLTKGISLNKSEWDVLNVDKVMDEEVKVETKSPYKTYNVKTVFEDFDYIDIKKMGGARKPIDYTGGAPKKHRSSKGGKPKKRSSAKGGASKKRSSAKGGKSRRRSSAKGGSSRKSSRKKTR
jgi:hypothetical protein